MSLHVRNSKNFNRFSQNDKAKFVFECLRAPGAAVELCRDAGVPLNVYLEWRAAFLEGGRKALSQEERVDSSELDDALCRKIVQSFPGNLLVSRPDDGRILYRSKSTQATFGRRRSSCEHWVEQTARKAFIDELTSTGQVNNMRFTGRKFDGSEFPAQLSSRLIEHEGTAISVTTSTDLTQVLAMSEQIEQANLRLNEALDALDEGFVLWDSELHLVMTNNRVIEMFGLQDAPPRSGSSLFSLRDRFDNLVEPPRGMSMKEAMMAGVQSLKSHRKNFKLRMRDGRTIICSAHKTTLDGYLCTFRDVTEQRRLQAELEHQREIAHQKEKLSALGELLAGVAHELNNPLSVVVGYALMLQERLTDPIDKKRIDRIGQAAERCARIVKTFLAMARQQPVDPKPLSLNDLIEAAIESTGAALQSNSARIVFELDRDLPMVDADADQLIQVFTNLIANANHALADKGSDGVLTLKTYFDPRCQRVVAEVVDNGPGVPRDIHARIFEPFFTTKREGEGTGIGLTFCHRIIETYGGRLSLKSRPEQGARFIMRLPESKRRPIPTRTSAEDAGLVRQACKILVVDDDVIVLDMLADLLRQSGFDVETANEAHSALKLLRSKSFDVILSDFRMPEMDGEAFFEELTRSFPRYARRLAFVTGDVMSPEIAEFLNRTGISYLEKPVVPSELDELVEKLCAPHACDPS